MRLLYGLVRSRRENTCPRLGGLGSASGDTGLTSREGLPCPGSVPPAPYQVVSRSLESVDSPPSQRPLPSPAPRDCSGLAELTLLSLTTPRKALDSS